MWARRDPKGLDRRWRSRPILQWLVLCGVLFAAIASWALGTPQYGSPDENAHVFRAAAVVRGEIFVDDTGDTGGGGTLHVPQNLVDTSNQINCYGLLPYETADCLGSRHTGGDLVAINSGAAKYNPVYYLLVGWPSLLTDDPAVIYAMRIVSAALSAALLASAGLSALRGLNGRLWFAALGVCTTPMVFFLAGMVNPNGLEVSAALAAWFAGMRLLTGTAPGEETANTRRLAIAGSLMVLTRGLSPLWLVLIGIGCLAMANREPLRKFFRGPRSWVAIAGLALSSLLAFWWTMTAGADQIPDLNDSEDLSGMEIFGAIMLQYLRRVGQFVGEFGWGDTPTFGFLTIMVVLLVGAFIASALLLGSRRQVIAVITAAAVATALPIYLEMLQFDNLGLFWQSRYSMPFAFGVLVMAAAAIPIVSPTSRYSSIVTRAAWLVAVTMMIVHLVSFDVALVRYASGLHTTMNPFDGSWSPSIGTLGVVLLQIAGVVGLYALGAVGFEASAKSNSRSAGADESDSCQPADDLTQTETATVTSNRSSRTAVEDLPRP